MWGKSVPGRGDSKDKGQVWPFEEQQGGRGSWNSERGGWGGLSSGVGAGVEGPEGCGEGLALLLKCSGRSQWPVFRKAQSHLECTVPVLLGREWTHGGPEEEALGCWSR